MRQFRPRPRHAGPLPLQRGSRDQKLLLSPRNHAHLPSPRLPHPHAENVEEEEVKGGEEVAGGQEEWQNKGKKNKKYS